MRKTALPEEVLLSVSEPARYIGGEVNMVEKDPSKVDVRFCMCFPDVYEIGMSHLGIQIIYDMLNRRDNIYCERVYSPWPDLDKIMRDRNIPLFALESQDPVRDFDFLGITLQYEMVYTNVLQILDLSHIPLHSCDRTWDDPIVIGGGPCAYNPEPLAPFFDIFYIGEGETVYFDLMDLYKESRRSGDAREEFLKKAAGIPGLYIPALYDVEYNPDGTLRSMTPNCPEAPGKVVKQIVMDVTDTYYPEKPLVPFIKATQDRVNLEVMRGCIRGCRFCQAGMIYRPVREKDVSRLKELAYSMLKSTGYEEITLSSLSSSDYSHLGELINFLIDEFKGKGVNISLPSLRIDAFSLDVMSKVQDIKKSSLTFSAEAGSQRMRDVINKNLTEEDILNGASLAFEGGWNKVKLYFMLGLPGETEEDIKGIAELSEKVAEEYYKMPKEKRPVKCQITASSSFFIPKPCTPFEWAPMGTSESFTEKAHIVNDHMHGMLNHKSLRYVWHDSDISFIEGVLARGDRKVSAVIEEAYKNGAMFDSWSEWFDNDKWMRAFETCGIDQNFYTTRERDLDELFPWDFIDIGVTKDFLRREWLRSKEGKVTPNCREGCAGCGAMKFGGGVCFENKG